MPKCPPTHLEVMSHSAEETKALGAAIGRRLRPNDVVLLFGDLGAGKTTLIQGIAKAHDVREPVTSPTFTLIHEYQGAQSTLVHIDPYRLEGSADVEGLGFLDYLGHGAILIVEWAERLGDLAPPEAMEIRIEHTATHDRRLRILWSNTRLAGLVEELKALK